MRLRRHKPEPADELPLHNEAVPLPPQAAELGPDNPRLQDLRARYAALDLPVTSSSRWRPEAVDGFLDHRYFRGETLIVWHRRENPEVTRLKYYVLTRYVEARDPAGYLTTLGEDGLFGCWTFDYPGHPPVSRDLLESVNEITFLERHGDFRRVLDIGAGYGRLAHRMTQARPDTEYTCVDAIPDSTFLCEWYLGYRNSRARAVALDEVDFQPGQFDIALNIHSFPEAPLAAITWWVEMLARLQVPTLLIVPNEPTEFLSLEPDGTRHDFLPVLEAHGYALTHREPVIDDAAERELLDLHDHFHLFAR